MPRGIPKASLEERFLKRTTEMPAPVEGMTPCKIWTGNLFVNGYGQLVKHVWGTRFAHQYACHRWNGSPLPVEDGYGVRHACDRRACVNPEHLSYAPLQENINDMFERNPTAFNKDNPTPEQIELLKQLLTLETPRREVARQLGHSRNWIDRVIRDFI